MLRDELFGLDEDRQDCRGGRSDRSHGQRVWELPKVQSGVLVIWVLSSGVRGDSAEWGWGV